MRAFRIEFVLNLANQIVFVCAALLLEVITSKLVLSMGQEKCFILILLFSIKSKSGGCGAKCGGYGMYCPSKTKNIV